MSTRTRDPARIRAIAKRTQSVDKASPWAKVFVFGDNGTGKTRFAASGPRAYIIDTNEQGTLSARGTGADVLEADGWEDIADAYWYMHAQARSSKRRYDTVAIDGLPGMHRMSMDYVTDEAERRNPDRPSKQADKRDYYRAGSLMGGLLLAFRNLPMHVVFTSTVRTIRDNDTNEIVSITPDLPGGVRGVALGACGVMGPLIPQKVKSRRNGRTRRSWADTMTVGPHEVYPTKDRTNQLGPVIIRPTMTKVISAWGGDTTTEEDE